MVCCPKSAGNFSRIAWCIFFIPVLSFALITRGFWPQSFSIRSRVDAMSFRMSALFSSKMTGMFFSSNCFIHFFSSSWASSSQRSKAMSVRSMAFSVRMMRISPNSPSSSNPGVSIKRQGPIPWISMALLTVSVVVPGISDTRAVSCPVKALIKEDLPLLRRPKRATCRRLADGVLFKLICGYFISLETSPGAWAGLESEISFPFFYLFQVTGCYFFYFRVGNVFQFFFYQLDSLGSCIRCRIIFQILFQCHQCIGCTTISNLSRFD